MLEFITCDSCGKQLDMLYNLSDIDLALCKHCNRGIESVCWINAPDVRITPRIPTVHDFCYDCGACQA